MASNDGSAGSIIALRLASLEVWQFIQAVTTQVTFSRPQRHVALGMGIGLSITLASFATAVLMAPHDLLPGSLGSRLEILALCALAPGCALALAITRLASHRFHTPEDLDGSARTPGTDRARLLQALLQNTLEQLELALPVYAAWALLAPSTLIPALPVAAILFLIGPGLFLRGYAHGAPGRALGFALTFYPAKDEIAPVCSAKLCSASVSHQLPRGVRLRSTTARPQ